MKKLLFAITYVFTVCGFAVLGFAFAVTGTESVAVPVLYVLTWAVYIGLAAATSSLGACAASLVYWLFSLGLSLSSLIMGETLSAGVIYRTIPYQAAAVFLPIGASGLSAENAKLCTVVLAAVMSTALVVLIAKIKSAAPSKLIVAVMPCIAVIGCMAVNVTSYAVTFLEHEASLDALNVSVTAIYLLLWLAAITLAVYVSSASIGIGFAVYWGACALLSLLSLAFEEALLPLSAIFLSPLIGLHRGSSATGFFFVCFAAAFVLCALSVSTVFLSGKKDGRISFS